MLPIMVDFRHDIADYVYMYPRYLNLLKILEKKSHFLLGPRAVGKSWLIRQQLPMAQVFDLLNTATYNRFLRTPSAFAQEITSEIVVVDEIQKLPVLLNEVHRLIEEKKIRFLLTGSSARKLKHGGANLLAGRARSMQMFPLTSMEIPNFDLERYCNVGGLPAIHQSEESWQDLRDYCQLYLKEEIIAEAVVRKIDHYARFLDVMGSVSGDELNYQSIANDSGVPSRTVANFIEILKDTLLAFELEPYQKTKKRKAVSKSKIYLFDVGVANYLAGRKEVLSRSKEFGIVFEHFILQEVRAYLGYHQTDVSMKYWRTVRGEFEVDLILGDEVAIEIKSAEQFQDKMLSGLEALSEEKKIKKLICVTRDPIERTVGKISVLPYSKFLDKLWNGEIVS